MPNPVNSGPNRQPPPQQPTPPPPTTTAQAVFSQNIASNQPANLAEMLADPAFNKPSMNWSNACNNTPPSSHPNLC